MGAGALFAQNEVKTLKRHYEIDNINDYWILSYRRDEGHFKTLIFQYNLWTEHETRTLFGVVLPATVRCVGALIE